jgi:LCP family protein required for cell wall assembly
MNTINVKKQGGKRKTFKTLLIVFCVLLALLIGCGIYVWVNYEKITGDLGFDPNNIAQEDEEDLGDYPEVTFRGGEVSELMKSQGNIDILLIGVDNRSVTKFTGLSDVIMYLRIDTKNGELKLASIMRDTLIPIEGHDYNKINTAFNYGGIDLTKKTLRSNFGLVPDYYIVVNFYGMEDIINALDGVDIELSDKEVAHMNGSIQEINDHDPDNSVSLVDGSGMQHLNGRQAVAYMRIRKVGSDIARIERQQKVLSQLFSKAKDINIGQFPGLIDTMSKYVRTDIKPASKMLDLASTIMGLKTSEIEKFRYPEDYEYGTYKSKDIVQPKDFETEIKKLHSFLEN